MTGTSVNNEPKETSVSLRNERKISIIQRTSLRIFEEVLKICERHQVRYYLVEGTLLGAVRNKGFIPWDDDIDIGIPVEEMERFINYCKKELPDPFFVDGYFDETRRNMLSKEITRVCDRDWKVVDFSDKTLNICIDIWPLVGLPQKLLARKRFFACVMLRKYLLRFCDPSIISEGYWNNQNWLKRTAIWIAKNVNLCRMLSYERESLILKRLVQKYPFESSDYVGNILSVYRQKEIVKRSLYGEGTEGEFEGMKVCLPSGYHELLKQIYGDYMTPPPEDKREGTHVRELIFCRDCSGTLG